MQSKLVFFFNDFSYTVSIFFHDFSLYTVSIDLTSLATFFRVLTQLLQAHSIGEGACPLPLFITANSCLKYTYKKLFDQ